MIKNFLNNLPKKVAIVHPSSIHTILTFSEILACNYIYIYISLDICEVNTYASNALTDEHLNYIKYFENSCISFISQKRNYV
jgi:hypothetical protein